jgi:hypothetical protein
MSDIEASTASVLSYDESRRGTHLGIAAVLGPWYHISLFTKHFFSPQIPPHNWKSDMEILAYVDKPLLVLSFRGSCLGRRQADLSISLYKTFSTSLNTSSHHHPEV